MNEIIELNTIKKLSESLMINNQALENSNKVLQTICLSIQQLMENNERQDAKIETLNNKINEITDKYESLVEGILTWDVREAINRMVRKIATKIFNNKFHKAWEKIYAEMLYKYNINVTLRKKRSNLTNPTIFDVLDRDETRLLVKSCLALCEMYRINIDDLKIEEQENNEFPDFIPATIN